MDQIIIKIKGGMPTLIATTIPVEVIYLDYDSNIGVDIYEEVTQEVVSHIEIENILKQINKDGQILSDRD